MRALRIVSYAIRRLPAPILGASLAGWILLGINASVPGSPLLCIAAAGRGGDAAADILARVDAVPLAAWVAGFAIMLLAMMPPLLSGALLHVWHRSLARRRHRAVLLFVVGYGAVWLAASLPLLVMTVLWDGIAGSSAWWPTVFAVALAVAWQATPIKQICLNRCHGRPPLATFGLAAEADALRYGAHHAMWCVGACWALMLPPLTGTGPWHVVLMLAVTFVALVERVRAPEAVRWGAALPALPVSLRLAPAR